MEVHFGENLKILIQLSGYNQQTLAEELGTTQNMIYLYCNNKCYPTVPKLIRIAEILRVDLNTLVLADLKNNLCDYLGELRHYKIRGIK